jgi:hypothetical protein
VFVQLPARVNVAIALWTALNIVAPLINLSILTFLLYALIMFLCLKYLLLL